jgi:hypothetical protein
MGEHIVAQAPVARLIKGFQVQKKERIVLTIGAKGRERTRPECCHLALQFLTLHDE